MKSAVSRKAVALICLLTKSLTGKMSGETMKRLFLTALSLILIVSLGVPLAYARSNEAANCSPAEVDESLNYGIEVAAQIVFKKLADVQKELHTARTKVKNHEYRDVYIKSEEERCKRSYMPEAVSECIIESIQNIDGVFAREVEVLEIFATKETQLKEELSVLRASQNLIWTHVDSLCQGKIQQAPL